MDVRVLMGINLRRLREARGMTQEQLRDASKVTQQYLSGLERGARNPTMTTLLKIAEALDATLLDLLAGADELRVKSKQAPRPKRRG